MGSVVLVWPQRTFPMRGMSGFLVASPATLLECRGTTAGSAKKDLVLVSFVSLLATWGNYDWYDSPLALWCLQIDSTTLRRCPFQHFAR